MNWHGHFDFRHLSRRGAKISRLLQALASGSPGAWRHLRRFEAQLLAPHTLYQEAAANTLADEGQELTLLVFLQGAALTTFYLALINDTLVETDTLATMLGEPTSNGYGRAQVTRDALGWPTMARNIPLDHTGTAQAGGNTTITLAAGASASDNFYAGCVVETTGGAGPRQKRLIIAYNGTTKVATVNQQWAVNPDATTTYTVHSDFMATSKLIRFQASGGSWGPVNTMVLTNVASGSSGKLISYASLTAAQTPSAGESFDITYKTTLRAD